MSDPVVDRITAVLRDADFYAKRADHYYALLAERVVAELHLTTETVHVEGEWGFGARDEVQIRGLLEGEGS